MTDDLDRLECEIKVMLTAWGPELSVEPSEAAVLRAKAAARHELNEAWLAEQPAPVPSDETLKRVRSEVRAELSRAVAETDLGRRRWFGWGPGLSSLAAAAMIGICVGLIHYVGTLRTALPQVNAQTKATVNYFAEAAEDWLAAEPVTTALRSELDTLEQSIGKWQPGQTADQTESFNELIDALDELLSRPAANQNTSIGHQYSRRGAFG